MARSSVRFDLEGYHCTPCSAREGVMVAELVRMIPMPIVINGKLQVHEYWCCPDCREPKFDLRGNRVKFSANVRRRTA